jgi:ankyrin repeat protein
VQQNPLLLDAEWGSTSSPLIAAAVKGHLEVVRYLLDEGADIDLRPDSDISAIEAACEMRRLEVGALLLASGADTAPDREGWTPLISASLGGHPDMVEMLLAHDGGEHIDHQLSCYGSTALHCACDYEQAGVARLLLGAGADPRVVDHDGLTPMGLAAQQGLEECVAVLQVITLRAYVFAVSASIPSGTHLTPPFQTSQEGRAATCSPSPAASAMLLPRWLTTTQATTP